MDLFTLAAQQYGVITRRQALERGMSPSALDRSLDRGEWIPLAPGVYRHACSPPSWRQELAAAHLAMGWPSAVSHRSAAALWKLSGFGEDMVELTCILGSAHTPEPRWMVHRTNWVESQITQIDGIPVTNVERTLMDLCAVIPLGRVARGLDEALMRGLTSVESIRGWLGEVGGRGRRGAGILRNLVDERAPMPRGLESVLEVKVMRIIRSAGLPLPTPQYELRDGSRVLARLDFAYPSRKFAIEADGFKYHGGRTAWRKDLDRNNVIAAMGWQVLHVTWDDLRDRRAKFISDVTAFLGEKPPVGGGFSPKFERG
ncbi:MAG TPA: type IV toxin-antitoxin system AbiEi family antitoxin domain-containing protein [Actinomycetota bacterium]|nr:type IV toxin-antitoxin system AbiEi family antitoxin domain-containing protein [Actinomycetota bacterium]